MNPIDDPPIDGSVLIMMQELSDKRRFGFYLYLIAHGKSYYTDISRDTGIPLAELVKIHRGMPSSPQYCKYIEDIMNYEQTWVGIYPDMKNVIIAILDAHYKHIDAYIMYCYNTHIRMLPYAEDEANYD